jgi:hypothetical protein
MSFGQGTEEESVLEVEVLDRGVEDKENFERFNAIVRYT